MTDKTTGQHAHRFGREAAAGDRADRAAVAPGGGRRRDRADPYLDLGAGHDRAARAADPQRAGRDRAGQAADRDPHPAAASSEAGLIERTPDPADGRSALVSVNAAGRERLRRLRGRKNAYLARRMRDLPADDVATLERAAEILEGMLEE